MLYHVTIRTAAAYELELHATLRIDAPTARRAAQRVIRIFTTGIWREHDASCWTIERIATDDEIRRAE